MCLSNICLFHLCHREGLAPPRPQDTWCVSHTVHELEMHEPCNESIMVGEDQKEKVPEQAQRWQNSSSAFCSTAFSNPGAACVSYLQASLQYKWNPSTFHWQKCKKCTDLIKCMHWVSNTVTSSLTINSLCTVSLCATSRTCEWSRVNCSRPFGKQQLLQACF